MDLESSNSLTEINIKGDMYKAILMEKVNTNGRMVQFTRDNLLRATDTGEAL